MEITVAYKCIFCSNVFLDEEKCKMHEKICLENPKNKTCKNCACVKIEYSKGWHTGTFYYFTKEVDVNDCCKSYEARYIDWQVLEYML